MHGWRVKIALVLALAIGCGGSSKPVQQPEPAPVATEPPAPVEKPPAPAKTEAEIAATQDALVAKFDEFATQACNCKEADLECAKRVSDDMTKWSEAQPVDSTPIQNDPRIAEIAKRLTDCITKAMTPKEPPPAPPEPAPTKAKPKKKAGAK